MKRILFTMILAVACTMTTTMLYAQTVYYVDPGKADTNDGLSWETAFKTVKKAVDKVTDTSPVTIYLKEDAVFSENNLTTAAVKVNLTIIGKNTVIKSPNSTYRIFRSEAASLTLKGITFEGVNGYSSLGGVLYFAGTNGANLVIDSCVFQNNALTSSPIGGAAIATGTGVTNIIITNSLFQNNKAATYSSTTTAGAVVYQQGKGTFTVENSTFANDTTISTTGASAFYCIADVSVRVVNCTFFNNTNSNSSTDGSTPTVYFPGASTLVAYVVNNTFYFDHYDLSSDDPKIIFRRNSAARVDAGTLHYINNVALGMRNALVANLATGRTITAKNNYSVVLEPHAYVTELPGSTTPVADANGNITFCVRLTNTGNPPLNDVNTLIANQAAAATGLATTLSTDRFPAYLPIIVEEEGGEQSPLIDAGLSSYIVNEAEYVPATDIRGISRTLTATTDAGAGVDIGAYEYVTIIEQEPVGPPDPPTGLNASAASGDLQVYASSGIIYVRSTTDTPIARIALYTPQGALVADGAVNATAWQSPILPAGLYLLKITTGNNTQIAKIYLR